MKNKALLFIIGGLFYISLCALFLFHVKAMATEISEEAHEMVDYIEDGYISLDEEIEEDDDSVLQDTIQSITPIEDEEYYREDSTEDNTENSNGDIVLENSTENEEIMNEDQYKIMVIFCLGLLLGSLIGNNLMGFLK